MYEITMNADETITVDFWGPRIRAAKLLRPQAWLEVVRAWQDAGGVLDFDASAVESLFCEARIDAVRARRMLDARGDVSVAPVDTRPDVALRGENQMIEDEAFNEDAVWDALRDRLGKTTISPGSEEDMDVFYGMRDTLKAEGKLRPGLRGI